MANEIINAYTGEIITPPDNPTPTPPTERRDETTYTITNDTARYGEIRYETAALTSADYGHMYESGYVTAKNPMVNNFIPNAELAFDDILNGSLDNPVNMISNYPTQTGNLKKYIKMSASSTSPTNPDGAEGRVVWLWCDSGVPNFIDDTSIGNFHLITHMEMKHVLQKNDSITQSYADVNYSSAWVAGFDGGHSRDNWSQRPNMLNAVDFIYYAKDEIPEIEDISTYTDIVPLLSVRPYIMYPTDGGYIIANLDICSAFTYNAVLISKKDLTSFNSVPVAGADVTYGIGIPVTNVPTLLDGFSATQNVFDSNSTNSCTYFYAGTFSGVIRNNYNEIYLSYAPSDLATFLKVHQCSGAFLLADKVYKPIINGGFVSDVSDDLNAASDIDNYDGSLVHHGGGGGGGGDDDDNDGDDLDDIGLTLNANGNSFISWYAVNRTQMEGIISWLNGHENYVATDEQDPIPAGFNAMTHIVGVMQAPVSISSISATTSAEIKIGGHSTGITGGLLTNQGSSSVIDVGSYQIPKKYDNFLDYEPYTKITVYIPYCGTVDLPPSIFVGHTVRVQLIYDIFSGECIGVVYCDNTFYTSLGGNFMTMHAISAENVGAIKQAVVNGCMSVIGSGAVAIGGIATGNIPVAVGGIGAMLGGTAKNLMEINGIAPTMRGNSGGRCNFYKPNNCIIYITRPQNAITDGFINTQGMGYNKTRTLSSGQGYTVVSNPVISGSMTDTEKQEIINALRMGVIL